MGALIKNQHILLAVTGGIAAYKSAELVRLMRKHGVEVRVAMTEAATGFISPLTFQALSGHAVHTALLDESQDNAMGHINLARWADALVIAPATANCLAKCRHGLADDLVSALYLTATCPVFMAPAMNQAMWAKAATQENVEALQGHGVIMIGPNAGEQACGETGFGRMAEAWEICDAVLGSAESGMLAGKTVLITAGPTREPIDPVRYLSNHSSGKMGYALAEAAAAAGASVTLVSGPVSLTPPKTATTIQVETAEQMHRAVLERAANHDIFIAAAAVADYRPVQVETHKIKKTADGMTLTLEKNPDILADVAKLEKPPFTVGFAAETHDLEHYALDKLARKNLNMVAANWIGRDQGGFGSELNALEVFWPAGRQSLPMTAKTRLAGQLIALIAERMHDQNTA